MGTGPMSHDSTRSSEGVTFLGACPPTDPTSWCWMNKLLPMGLLCEYYIHFSNLPPQSQNSSYASTHPPTYVPIHPLMYPPPTYVPIRPFMYPPPTYVPIHPLMYPSTHLCTHPPTCVPINPHMYPSTHICTHPPTYVPIHPLVYPSTHLLLCIHTSWCKGVGLTQLCQHNFEHNR